MRLKLYRGKWAVVGINAHGKTYRRSLGTADRAEAERKFRDVRIETPGDTVADAVALYMKEKQGRARSYEAMEASWKALRPLFGHLRPDQIDRALCRRYAAGRRTAGRSDGTVIKDLGFLRTALKWANKPGAQWELPSAPPPRDRALSRAEYARLLEACELPHIRLFVVLALHTGGRASALLELTWDQIDFDRGRVALSKGEDRRKGRATVPMTAPAREALETAYKERTSDFVIEWAGRPLKSIKRAFRAACAAARLSGVTPHVLRHTCAVWQAEAGVPMSQIAQYLGHTNSRITEAVYARYSPEFLRAGARALE